jgi:hypothetical protein
VGECDKRRAIVAVGLKWQHRHGTSVDRAR